MTVSGVGGRMAWRFLVIIMYILSSKISRAVVLLRKPGKDNEVET